MKILVSGFEAFGGESLNPTALIVSAIQKGECLIPQHVNVRAVLLPVVFGQSFERLQVEIQAFDPDVILALGQAGGRDAVELERIAINCRDAEIPDNDGFRPQGEMILSEGANAYFSTLPLRQLEEALQRAGISARLSNSAGTYVCNDLFYRMQEACLRTRRRSGFIHVPFLPEQASGKANGKKPGVASMSIDQMKQALAVMLEALASEVEK